MAQRYNHQNTATGDMSSSSYDDGQAYDKGHPRLIERMVTPGGHPADFSQPAIPPQHRKYGNPTPLGLVSFGTGFFLVSAFNLHAQGIQTPNVYVPVLVLFGGITQSLCGWWEMFLGNTFGATIFGSYGAFNLTFGALFLPAFGVTQAYTLPDGTMSPQYNQAIGMFNFTWMMVTILFIIGSLRSSMGVLLTLIFTALALLAAGIQYCAGIDAARIAGGVFGMVATGTAWWTAMSGFYVKETTFPWIHLPPGDVAPKDNELRRWV